MAGRRSRGGAFSPEKLLEVWFPLLMRGGGLFIAIYAATVHDFDRPSLYVLASGMMFGEPIVKWWVRARNGNGS